MAELMARRAAGASLLATDERIIALTDQDAPGTPSGLADRMRFVITEIAETGTVQ